MMEKKSEALFTPGRDAESPSAQPQEDERRALLIADQYQKITARKNNLETNKQTTHSPLLRNMVCRFTRSRSSRSCFFLRPEDDLNS